MSTSLDNVRLLSPRITADYLEEQCVIPLEVTGETLHLGTWLPALEPDVVYELESLLGARWL